MSIATEAGLSFEKVQEVADLVKSAGEKAVHLRIVERFLSEVERRLLKASPVVFDIERIRAALQILKTISDDDDIEECLEAEFRLEQEFHLWRGLIIERDKKIETYHFRRLCDSTPYPLDDEIFVALASFYRGLEFSPASQSKFDLAVTRLFSKMSSPDRREMSAGRNHTVAKLRLLFGHGENDRAGDIAASVSSIDGFTDEANHLGVFEDLVRSNIFDRYRVFKRELGSLFFEPEIVAAAIECNITVGNVFDDLLKRADEQLSARLKVDVDLPSALHDASPEGRAHISELFKVFFGDSDKSGSAGETDADYLGKLLMVTGPRTPVPRVSEHSAEQATLQDRLAPILRTLTEARPNAELLTSQLRRLESAGAVNINDFLYNKAESPDVLARRVLGLILWTIEFRESELGQQKELTESIQRECTALLVKIEHLTNKLEAEIEHSDEYDQTRLRTVMNCLRDSRSRLERSIVRFTNRKMASAETAPAAVPATVIPVAAQPKPSFGSAIFRWVVISLVLSAVTAATLYFVNKQFDGVLTSTSGFASVDLRTLPQHELMKSAYRHDHTLFINAHPAWKEVAEDERAKALKAIIDDPKYTRVQTVVVMGDNGDVIESRSRQTPANADPQNFSNDQ